MEGISAKYFSTKFITENKLKLADITILEYIYSWVLSDNPPQFKFFDSKRAFYLSQSHIAKDYDGLITQACISQKIKKLQRCKIIDSTEVNPKGGEFFVYFNWEKVMESLAPQEQLKNQKYKYCSNWFEKIFQYMKEEQDYEKEWNDKWKKMSVHERIEYFKKSEEEEKEMPALLNESDMNMGKPKYCLQADAIAKKILSKYGAFFTTQVPRENREPSKVYTRLCNKITDIYNGHFTSSRLYSFDENVFNNKQFNTEGWMEKIKAVKGDWNKVRKLIFTALKNFVLMYDEDKMPLNKNYLTTNLSDWFYSDNPNSRGQSQFIQSLNEPQIIKKKLGDDKAKKIIEDMREKSPVSYLAGHELNALLPANASELTAWKSIREIIQWGKLLWQYEPNAKYFLQCEIDGRAEAGAKVLPALFARYMKEKKISVSLGTLNIQQAVDNNAPWSWFIADACKTYDMNPDCLYCFENADFYDAYNKINGINEEEEIPVF